MCSTFNNWQERLCDGEGLLSEWYESFFSQMQIQGYAHRTVQRRQTDLARLDSWLRQPDTDRRGSFEEVVQRYLHNTDLRSTNPVHISLNHFLEHLHSAGAIEFSEPPAADRASVDGHVDDFKDTDVIYADLTYARTGRIDRASLRQTTSELSSYRIQHKSS